MKIELEDCTVEFSDSQETKELGQFNGESLCQGDAAYIEGPVVLAKIADELFKFKVEDNN